MLSYKRYLNKAFLNGNDPEYISRFYESKDIIWTSSGRGSFELILNTLNLESDEYVLLPAIIAHGIILPLKRKKIPFLFYKCSATLVPDKTDILNLVTRNKVRLAVFVHYFGFPQELSPYIDELKSRNVIIIEDCAQAFLSKDKEGSPLGKKGDIALFSLPKFIPVPDGSFIIFNNNHYKPANINFHVSLFSTLSRYSHFIYLKLKAFQLKLSPSIVYSFINIFSKGLYFIYYKSICIQRNPVEISKYTKRIIRSFDFDKFRRVRQEHSKKVYSALNKSGYNFFNCNYNDYCTTGIPIEVGERKAIISKFRKKNIEVLTYTKYWDFIPKKQKEKYVNESNYLNTHLLIPSSENFDDSQVNHIIKTIQDVL